MITVLSRRPDDLASPDVSKVNKEIIEYCGLSTDEKPNGLIVTGSTFLEIDTGDLYIYNEEAAEWVQFINIKDAAGGGGGSWTPKYVVRNEKISLTDYQGIITTVDESLLVNGGNYLIKAAFTGDWYYGGTIATYDDVDGWGFDPIYLGQNELNIYQEDGSWIVYSRDINVLDLSIIVDDLGIEPEEGD